jgi:class 3 adenylate cyclase
MRGLAAPVNGMATPDVAETSKPVHLRPITLRFDDAEREEHFRHEHDATALPVVRMAAILAILLFAIFGILDTQIAEEGLRELLVMRGLVVAMLALAFAITFHPRIPHIQQFVVWTAVFVAGLGIASMNVIATVPVAVPAMGMTLILIFLFSFVRVRFVNAVITAGLLVAAYEVTLLVSGAPALDVVYLNSEIGAFVVIGASVSHTLDRLWRVDFLRREDLERERLRSDTLLHNVLPESIARRLRLEPSAIAEAVDHVPVLFADLVDFTPLTERVDPRILVAALGGLFARFDELCDEHAVEKIKTIGDGYMAVAGVPDAHPDPVGAIAALAIDMRDTVTVADDPEIGALEIRIGICTGPVIAGVIGRRRFAYDLWGDTVNLASRLESHGSAGVIQVCAETRARLENRYQLAGPHLLQIKGKGEVEAWHLLGRLA